MKGKKFCRPHNCICDNVKGDYIFSDPAEGEQKFKVIKSAKDQIQLHRAMTEKIEINEALRNRKAIRCEEELTPNEAKEAAESALTRPKINSYKLSLHQERT